MGIVWSPSWGEALSGREGTGGTQVVDSPKPRLLAPGASAGARVSGAAVPARLSTRRTSPVERAGRWSTRSYVCAYVSQAPSHYTPPRRYPIPQAPGLSRPAPVAERVARPSTDVPAGRRGSALSSHAV